MEVKKMIVNTEGGPAVASPKQPPVVAGLVGLEAFFMQEMARKAFLPGRVLVDVDGELVHFDYASHGGDIIPHLRFQYGKADNLRMRQCLAVLLEQDGAFIAMRVDGIKILWRSHR